MPDTTELPSTVRSIDDDEPIGIRVGHDMTRVIVDLGATLRWVGLTPIEVRVLAKAMLEHADDCEAGR